MKKLVLILLALAMVAPVFARDVDAFVSADWVEANLSNPRVVILDVRAPAAYREGHIPGAVNMVGGTFYVAKDGLNNEVPAADELSEAIAECGIDANSIVVVVEADSAARFAWATRVAWTLVYAGVPNVAVLDGGHAEWVKAGKGLATGFESKDETEFKAAFNANLIADKAFVLKNVKKAQIVDARAYDTYFGLSKQAFVDQFGHVPGAYALPAAWITKDGKVRPAAELAKMVADLKLSAKKDMIIHCDSGVLCTAWWWVLTQQMGWTRVRSYDGSAQEIGKADSGVKFVTHVWR